MAGWNDVNIAQNELRGTATKHGYRVGISTTNGEGNTRYSLYDSASKPVRVAATGNRPSIQDKLNCVDALMAALRAEPGIPDAGIPDTDCLESSGERY